MCCPIKVSPHLARVIAQCKWSLLLYIQFGNVGKYTHLLKRVIQITVYLRFTLFHCANVILYLFSFKRNKLDPTRCLSCVGVHANENFWKMRVYLLSHSAFIIPQCEQQTRICTLAFRSYFQHNPMETCYHKTPT